MLKQIFAKYFPPHWQGVAVDTVFVLLNLFLLPLLGSKIQKFFDESLQDNKQSFIIISLLIFTVFFWRFIALFIKRIPVQNRLENENGLDSVGCLWILNLFAVLLSTSVILAVILNFLKMTGVGDFSSSDYFIGSVGLFFPVIEIYLLYRLTKPLSKYEKKNKRRISFGTELFADAGLFAYMFIWQAFYNTISP